MNNYVLLYHFTSQEDEKFFTNSFESVFESAKPVKDENFKYYAFSAGELPEVKDQLTGILGRIGIDNKEYVALYYTRESNPDSIKREMILGKDSFMTGDLNSVPAEEHRRALTELFSISLDKDKN
jgi:hypothetical protein